ncbi:proline racemase family protein [Amphritea sp.]|uniref:proline racemase family protein n=1 Tax=Amphritea sp. TaxID=1872502 RepID=UPI003A9136C9
MQWNKKISVLGVHAEGEIGRVITAGVLDIPGRSMMDKMNYINTVDDSIRRFALFEPRGFSQMTVNLLLPATQPEADVGFIPMQPDCAHALSGSNSMCVTTALLETGMIPMQEPHTEVVLDTPAGLVTATAHCENGKCKSVSLTMVPSFVEALDQQIEVEGLGKLTVDIAYGGCYFALVDANALGLKLRPSEARTLVELGTRIKQAAAAQISVQHPLYPSLNKIEYAIFTGNYEGELRSTNIIYPGRVDRSPCGAGSSARLAVMYARHQIAMNEPVKIKSTIDGRFICEVVAETTVGDKQAIIPRIEGRAWIYSMEEYGVDPSDPFPLGYTLSDTWGPEI